MFNKRNNSFNSFAKLKDRIVVFLFILVLFLPVPLIGTNVGGLLIFMLKIKLVFLIDKFEDQQKNAKNNPERMIEPRFQDELTIQPGYKNGIWVRAKVGDFNVWVDSYSGTVWLDSQGYLVSKLKRNRAQISMSYCRELKPKGYWDLPTFSEFALGISHNMQDVIEDISGKKWLFQLEASSFSMEGAIPFEINFNGAPNDGISVRCVGRTNAAPAQGYGVTDINKKVRMKLFNFMEANQNKG